MQSLPAYFLAFSVISSTAFAEMASAQQMPVTAKNNAAAEDKAIFVHFGASWHH